MESVPEENKHHTKVCNSLNLSIAPKKSKPPKIYEIRTKSDWTTLFKRYVCAKIQNMRKNKSLLLPTSNVSIYKKKKTLETFMVLLQ